MMPQGQPRIAIVGAGPGGLTLGLLLHNRDIPFTVYDLRPRPDEEEIAAPCGMLDLHEGSGLAAIHACGLYDDFLALTGECEEAAKVVDKNADILHQDSGGVQARPEIARNKLSGLLLSKLPAESVRHNTKLLSTRRDPGIGQVTLELESTIDGTIAWATCDCVVGADGAWSRVRRLLTDEKPKPTGVMLLTLAIKHVSTRFPHLSDLTGRGSFICLGNRHVLSSHRSAQDAAYLYLMISAPEDAAVTEFLGSASLPDLREKLLDSKAFFADHAPILKELVGLGFDEEISNGADLHFKAISMLPIGHRWEHRSGVTLIGDSAHLMMPSGEGVNLAMVDALDLSRAIGKAWDESRAPGRQDFNKALDLAAGEFEDVMFTRAHEEAEDAWTLRQTMFAENGAQKMVDFFDGAGRQPVSE